MLHKKSLLESFVIVPQEFIFFISSQRAIFHNYSTVNKKLSIQDKEKIIRNFFLSSFNKDYFVINGSKVYSFYKNQYKQIIFNIRSKKINEYRDFLKRYNKSNVNVWKSVLTYKKIEFANSFAISIYDIKSNKHQINFYPFISLSEQTSMKHNHINSVNYTRKEIKKGVLRFPNF
jgi:hypothetical protein